MASDEPEAPKEERVAVSITVTEGDNSFTVSREAWVAWPGYPPPDAAVVLDQVSDEARRMLQELKAQVADLA